MQRAVSFYRRWKKKTRRAERGFENNESGFIAVFPLPEGTRLTRINCLNLFMPSEKCVTVLF